MVGAVKKWQKSDPQKSLDTLRKLSEANSALEIQFNTLSKLAENHWDEYKSLINSCSILKTDKVCFLDSFLFFILFFKEKKKKKEQKRKAERWLSCNDTNQTFNERPILDLLDISGHTWIQYNSCLSDPVSVQHAHTCPTCLLRIMASSNLELCVFILLLMYFTHCFSIFISQIYVWDNFIKCMDSG